MLSPGRQLPSCFRTGDVGPWQYPVAHAGCFLPRMPLFIYG